MSFNFGSLATIQEPNSTKYLKPYNIYENVEFVSSEVKEGATKEGKEWKCLHLTVANDEGEYTESLFYPSDGDDERKETDGANGGKRLMCSNFEVTMAMVAAFGRAFNPEGFKKLQAASGKFKSFDEVVKGLVTILNATKGKVKTTMKLVGRTTKDGRVYARLPQPIGIIQDKDSEEWRTFPVAIFGDNLTFSAYEEKKKAELQNAKPTDMAKADNDVANAVDAPTKGSEDIDFSSLI